MPIVNLSTAAGVGPGGLAATYAAGAVIAAALEARTRSQSGQLVGRWACELKRCHTTAGASH